MVIPIFAGGSSGTIAPAEGEANLQLLRARGSADSRLAGGVEEITAVHIY